MNPIIGSNVNQGIAISTVFLADRGWWETCLFDDRKGKRMRNHSRVVQSYGTEFEAIAGHGVWINKTLGELLDALAGPIDDEPDDDQDQIDAKIDAHEQALMTEAYDHMFGE